MKLIRQFDRMDCGPACVCMIASHYGRRVSLPYVRTLCGLTREGVSIAGIRKALEVLGFESVALKMTAAQLQQDCPLPAVLYWEQRHFVVLEKVTKNGKYVICDPAAGRCKYSPDDFARKWLNGESGVVVAAQPASDLGTAAGRTSPESIVDFARRYVFPYKAQLFQALCALAVGMLIGLLLPLLTKVMVDDGVGGRDFGFYERMRSAINTACLDDFVASHPLGLHRALGTEGTGVSGGERQRIMIARAVYKNPSCLILDEATSSLDAETEARITHNLDDCFAATTRIVIAHRLSTVRNADHIIVMHRGRVVESGTHMQLIEREGYYFNLIRNQLELAAT